jgi:ParB family chromosome partitioning protein
MSKPARKSLIASFGALAAGINTDNSNLPVEGTDAPSPQLTPRVGAGVIGATQRAISEIRDERDQLRALLDAGTTGARQLDAALIDPSPYPDRLADDDEAEFIRFRQTFEQEGQKVPIQVRPHPSVDGRYQVIYGHRRLRAAQELGRPVDALIMEMNDQDLVVSQGIENSSRQDLSWIERAIFAARMANADIRSRDIKAALGIDDAELAKMRSVTRGIPVRLIEAVGRAPKIGRPRWLELASLLEDNDAVKAASETLSTDKVLPLSSDERFKIVLASVKSPKKTRPESPNELRDDSGRLFGRVTSAKKEVRILLERDEGKDFAAFLAEQMPELLSKFAGRGE